MVIHIRRNVTDKEIDELISYLKEYGINNIHYSYGKNSLDMLILDPVIRNDIFDFLMRYTNHIEYINDPFYLSNRKFHYTDTIVKITDEVSIGGGNFAVIAGPCSIESEEQLFEIATKLKASGASILRGGAFKLRTSPFSFQGLREDGIKILLKVKSEINIPVVTEITDIRYLDLFNDIDIIQVGARNMQNFDLLKELGRTKKPILLKRGMSSTIKDLLMSADHIMSEGNENVILCERGIKSFENYTRNATDMSIIPLIHKLSHLPIIVDPSHATGHDYLVPPMCLAATISGADGLIVEVHNDPENALCDGHQSITPKVFDETMKKINMIRPYSDSYFTVR